MKCLIFSAAVLGLASSVSGALQLCQYYDSFCDYQKPNCFEPLFTEGCHTLPYTHGMQYQASKVGNTIVLNTFENNCALPNRENPFKIQEGQCLTPTFVFITRNSEVSSTSFAYKLENNGAQAAPITTEAGKKTGAGTYVLPSLMASVSAVLFGVLL